MAADRYARGATTPWLRLPDPDGGFALALKSLRDCPPFERELRLRCGDFERPFGLLPDARHRATFEFKCQRDEQNRLSDLLDDVGNVIEPAVVWTDANGTEVLIHMRHGEVRDPTAEFPAVIGVSYHHGRELRGYLHVNSDELDDRTADDGTPQPAGRLVDMTDGDGVLLAEYWYNTPPGWHLMRTVDQAGNHPVTSAFLLERSDSGDWAEIEINVADGWTVESVSFEGKERALLNRDATGDVVGMLCWDPSGERYLLTIPRLQTASWHDEPARWQLVDDPLYDPKPSVDPSVIQSACDELGIPYNTTYNLT